MHFKEFVNDFQQIVCHPSGMLDGAVVCPEYMNKTFLLPSVFEFFSNKTESSILSQLPFSYNVSSASILVTYSRSRSNPGPGQYVLIPVTYY